MLGSEISTSPSAWCSYFCDEFMATAVREPSNHS